MADWDEEINEHDDWNPYLVDEDQDAEDIDDPCAHCGPSCEHWGGDGLCLLDCEQLGNAIEEYHADYVKHDVPCPGCGKILTEYSVPVDELWHWPGDIDPRIGLEVYAAYGVPKGVLHSVGSPSQGTCHHVWIGAGALREERLIFTSGKMPR